MDTANPYDLTKIMHYQLSLLRLSTALKTPTPIDLESSRSLQQLVDTHAK